MKLLDADILQTDCVQHSGGGLDNARCGVASDWLD